MRALPLLVSAIALVAWPIRATPQRPADAGRVASEVREYLEGWRKEAAFPGVSIGIVLKDGTPIAVTSGVADREAQTPMRGEDLLLAGSTGKTFFAAVAVQLIETGRLDLDAPIAKYLGSRPWFRRLPNANDITVRHLMTHTSGLVRYEMNPAFTADLRAQPDKVWTPEEEIAYLFDAAPPFAPGQGWDYSDTNYIVLGMIVESITGTKLYDEVQRRFLTPLGLTRIAPSTSRRIPGLVPGYAGPRDPLGLPDRVVVDGQFVINPQFEWTGGGYATSAGDLARWGHELYAGRAISARARALMIDAAVPARLGPETKYGLGVIVRPATPVGLTWGHSGFFPGYQTELVHATASGVTVAVQVNTSAPRATGNRSPLRAAYDIAAIATGHAPPSQSAAPASPAPASGVVTVDVAVVDADGRPVPNLTAADFRVEAGGASRRVLSAEYVGLPARRSSNGPPAPASPAPPRSSTNAKPFSGRTMLIVADVGYIPEGAGGDVMAAIGRHLDSFDPADRVGFIDVPIGTPRVDPTADRDVFRDETRQVAGISNRWLDPTMTYGEAAQIKSGDTAAALTYWRRTNGGARGCNARMPRPYAAPATVSPDCQQAADRAIERYRRETQSRLDTLRGMIAPMSTLDGQKVLVIVSGGLLLDAESRDSLYGLAETAERGRVAVYALQVDQTKPPQAETLRATAALDDRIGFDGLSAIARLARGAAFRLSAAPESVLARLDAELSGYYTLGLERTASDVDDHRVEMDVSVNRPGLEVRSRRAFTPGPAGAAAAETDLHTRIDEMIKRPVGWASIGLDAAAYPLVPASRDEVPVTIAVEIDRPMKAIAAVGYEITSTAGKVVADAFEGSPGLRNLGTRALFTATVEMKPGRYRLKVAAIDADGGRGSLEHRFDVAEPPASGVRVSEVLLGDDSTGQFRPVVRVAPDLPSVVARVELAAAATAFPGLGAAVTIVPRGQEARASDAVAVPIVTMQGSQRRFAAGRVDLRSLPPGEYVITVVISSPAGEVARRSRLFEK